MRTFLTRLIGSLAIATLLSNCFFNDKEAFTVVKGRVIDKYTDQGIAHARLTVLKLYPNFTHVRREIIAQGQTDARGEYNFAFTATGRQNYRIQFQPDDSVAMDLTSYQTLDANSNGVRVQKGKTNELDFLASPYKTVTVRIDADKGGKNYFGVYCLTVDRDETHTVDIAIDTSRTTQRVVLTRPVRLLPMRRYRFVRSTGNQIRQGHNYIVTDATISTQEREVLYTDTTTIIIH